MTKKTRQVRPASRSIRAILNLTLAGMLLACQLEATVLRVEDPSNNLTGDQHRRFIDITTLEMETGEDHFQIRIVVDAPFPEPELLLGTGMQLRMTFLSNSGEGTPVTIISEIIFQLSDRGWNLTEPSNPESHPWIRDLGWSIDSREFRVSLPASFFTEVTHVRVTSSTANYPKWKPVTSNPPVEINLPQDPATLMR